MHHTPYKRGDFQLFNLFCYSRQTFPYKPFLQEYLVIFFTKKLF